MAEQLATDEEINTLVGALQTENDDDIAPIDTLLGKYPDDPRLHFMRGSVLAGKSRPLEAHEAMKRAVEIAPGFAIARYQLGFFEMTSGEADRALSTWGPLLAQPDDNYLRVFVEGMTHLIRDEFEPTIEKFERGIALNQENEPLNNDIRLLMGEIRKLAEKRAENPDADSDDLSATSLILGQFGGNKTIN
ncbi:tetratricopeptide repeat protein [Parerythrobacter jejuensis]|uniref:Tetratricopeptide repeat protein n=1 Tax=Parerythrobacter jejuensis TaxID=795812 RepID=A0A845AX40_9SPHN|nr:hypothetical protein [Parerythrobacter jejuensis]MXP30581.1 hypothetical protein [Parerythrobacter jejuensis]MXP33341.1 hypothetical protein [Parerythrobacter jejuensis]